MFVQHLVDLYGDALRMRTMAEISTTVRTQRLGGSGSSQGSVSKPNQVMDVIHERKVLANK